MKKYSNVLKKVIVRIIHRNQLTFFILSLICILFLYLKLFNIEEILHSTSLSIPWLFMISISTIFTILFLPSYPIFFIILEDLDFNFREKLGITIVSNLSFYIIVGFIGCCLNLLITFEFFLITLTLAYFSLIIIAIFQVFHRKTGVFFKKAKSIEYNNLDDENFSLSNFIKRYISLNGILLVIFIILICILNIVNTRFFAGTDPWLHISIVKYITEINYIPMNEYYGALGLHIFGAVIHFFSGLDLLLLPKFYLFYTIPLSSLIIYNFLRRIFKNKNIAIFGVYLLFSSFGFTFFMMAQFWPSGIALIQGLVIFFILYVRLQPLIREQIPKKENILPNMVFLYILLTFIFISSFLTHSLITMILLISYFWVYLIYFAINYRRGIDFLLLILFFGIFLIFYYLNISTGHFQVFNPLNILPWYYIFFGFIAVIFFVSLVLLHYRKSMNFTRGTYRLIISGKKKNIYTKIEDKYIVLLIFSIAIISSSIFIFFTLTMFNINIVYIFYFIDILFIALFAIWGMAIFQYKPRAKPIYLWGIAIDLLFLVIYLFDATIGITTFFLRVLHITLIMIVIGFLAYLYNLIQNNSFQKKKFKFFLVFILFFSMFSSYLFDSASRESFFLKEREVNSIQWYCNYTSNEKVIISKFGWYAIYIYYDYPFKDKNKELTLESIHYFLLVETQYIHPSLHISNGTNMLKELKSSYNTEVVLILPKDYYSPFEWTFFDQLNEEEVDTYFNLEYLNRIFSAKEENGEDIPYYWVI